MSVHRPVCPCCGYDLEADQPILINDFSMFGAGYPLFYKGIQVPLTPSRAMVCWALMKAYPAKMTTSALMERIGYEGGNSDFDNIIKVHVSRIRKTLRDIGAPNPIHTMRPHAYIWNPIG